MGFNNGIERRERMRSRLIITAILTGLLAFLAVNTAMVSTNGSNSRSQLQGFIGDVFGDPIPEANISLGTFTAVTDGDGNFQFSSVPHGLYAFKVEASGYKAYKKELSISQDTMISLRYDQGLWPVNLGADFHVYYNYGYDGNFKAFAEVGIANGGDKNYYVVSCTILDPYSNPIKELLDTEEAYRNFSGGLGQTRYTRLPRLAVLIEPGKVYVLKAIPLKEVPVKGARYNLKIIYGDLKEHEGNSYRTRSIEGLMELDEDWNPHTPPLKSTK